MDKNKLLYFIKDRGFSIKDFCEAIKMSYSSFYKKLNGSKFLIGEIWQMSEFLNLTIEDINSIFFADYVS